MPVIGVYQWLPEIGAALIAEQSQSEAFAPARQLAFVTGGAGLARRRSARVGDLLRVAADRAPDPRDHRHRERGRRGELTREAPVMTEDEVGELAGASTT